MEQKITKDNEAIDAGNDQQQLNQQALGNTAINDASAIDADKKSMPKITGTGSNNAAAAPESLIVHEDEQGNKRYESPKADDSEPDSVK